MDSSQNTWNFHLCSRWRWNGWGYDWAQAPCRCPPPQFGGSDTSSSLDLLHIPTPPILKFWITCSRRSQVLSGPGKHWGSSSSPFRSWPSLALWPPRTELLIVFTGKVSPVTTDAIGTLPSMQGLKLQAVGGTSGHSEMGAALDLCLCTS